MSAAAFEVAAGQVVDDGGGRMVGPCGACPSPVDGEGNKGSDPSSERDTAPVEVAVVPGKDNRDAGTANRPMVECIGEGILPC